MKEEVEEAEEEEEEGEEREEEEEEWFSRRSSKLAAGDGVRVRLVGVNAKRNLLEISLSAKNCSEISLKNFFFTLARGIRHFGKIPSLKNAFC